MIKGCLFIVVGFMLLFSIPICLGIAGGIFGLIAGLIGGLFGLFFGLLGGIIEFIAWIFKGIFHLFFGWHNDFGFHHWHFNGFAWAALIILIAVIATRKRN